MHRFRDLLLVVLMMLVFTTTFAQELPPADVINDEGGAAFISGTADYTFPYFEMFLPEPFIVLYDVAGLVERDVDFYPAIESQVFGEIVGNAFVPPFKYELSLPVIPRGEFRDVDNDGEDDSGVMLFMIAATSNTWGDPFVEERDNFVAGIVSSVQISSDIDTFLDLTAGKLIIYADDKGQGFPSGFGEDGILFTADDPIVTVPTGYTVVDLDTDPFTFDRSRFPDVALVEAEEAELDDFSDLGYVDAFDAMIELLREKYAFTEYKDIDWDSLSAEFRPRIEAAEASSSNAEYRRALRDLAWAIPDGHVSGPVTISEFQNAVSGGLGLVMRETDDGQVLVTKLIPGLPADRNGIKLRAQILEINNVPIQEALDANIPWTSPFSTEHFRRLEQLRFIQRFPIGTPVSLTFRNPGDEVRTVDMNAEFDPDSYTAANINQSLEGTELPVEFEILDSGYGYLSIYSFSDNLPLMVALWERVMLELNAYAIPGLIIDVRQNGGGSAFLGDQLPAYFFEEEFVIGNTARYSEARGEFVVNPDLEDTFILPDESLRYYGPIAVLISPSCASACESFSYAMTINDRAAIVGYYPTAGLGGSVVPIAMPDDVTFSYTQNRGLDAEGNIHIEGKGVAPTVRVPVTEETLFSEDDVLLQAAIDYLDSTQNSFSIREEGIAMLGDTIEVNIQRNERLRYSLDVEQGQFITVIAAGKDDAPLNTVVRVYIEGNPEPVIESFSVEPGDVRGGFADLEIPQQLTLIIEIGTINDSLTGDLLLTFEDVTP